MRALEVLAPQMQARTHFMSPTALLLPPCQDALDNALRLVLVVPLADLLAFRKFSRAWFSLTEVLAHAHTGTLVQQVCENAGLPWGGMAWDMRGVYMRREWMGHSKATSEANLWDAEI